MTPIEWYFTEVYKVYMQEQNRRVVIRPILILFMSDRLLDQLRLYIKAKPVETLTRGDIELYSNNTMMGYPIVRLNTIDPITDFHILVIE